MGFWYISGYVGYGHPVLDNPYNNRSWRERFFFVQSDWMDNSSFEIFSWFKKSPQPWVRSTIPISEGQSDQIDFVLARLKNKRHIKGLLTYNRLRKVGLLPDMLN